MGGFPVFPAQRAEEARKRMDYISCCSCQRYVDGSGRNRSAVQVEDIMEDVRNKETVRNDIFNNDSNRFLDMRTSSEIPYFQQ